MKTNFSAIILVFILIGRGSNLEAQIWFSFLTPTATPVKDMTVYNGKLIIGHWYSSSNNNYIESYDGVTFDTIGTLNAGSPYIMAMEIFNNDLYVGGIFDSINGVAANGLARWDGTNWHAVFAAAPYSMIDNIGALKAFNGELYAGGFFSMIDSIPCNNIAKWNGVQWIHVGAGFNTGVEALNTYQNNLYAGGYFILSGTDTVNRIAKWDNTIWQPLNLGIEPNDHFSSTWCIYSIQEYNGELYAGGDFFTADSVYTPCIAKWNGTNWTYPGFSLPGWVMDMTIYNNKLFLGSDVYDWPLNIHYVVSWNGTLFDTLGGGIGQHSHYKALEAVQVFQNRLYVGGAFSHVNNIYSQGMAVWDEFVNSIEEFSIEQNFNLFPNPATSLCNITSKEFPNSFLTLYDLTGRALQQQAFNTQIQLDISKLVSGMYVIEVKDQEGRSAKGKLVKE